MKEILIESLIYSVIVYFLLVSAYDIILKPIFRSLREDKNIEEAVKRKNTFRRPITLKKKESEFDIIEEPLYRPEDLV